MDNTRDSLYMAVEEYNTMIIKHKQLGKLTDAEMTGMLYTTLKRHLNGIGKGRRHYGHIRSDHLLCTFHPNGTLQTFRVDKSAPGAYNGSIRWDVDIPATETIRQLITIAREKDQFYPTKDMNEIADIVSSIK